MEEQTKKHNIKLIWKISTEEKETVFKIGKWTETEAIFKQVRTELLDEEELENYRLETNWVFHSIEIVNRHEPGQVQEIILPNGWELKKSDSDIKPMQVQCRAFVYHPDS